MISVLVLTKDEATNIVDCLESASWSDDLVVLDSISNDSTVEFALRHGARVVTREFDNYSNQRNFGLNQIEFKHPWVLMLDADERTPDELVAEMNRVVMLQEAEIAMFRMRRKDMFMGRWIRRSSGYPTWFGRLVRVGRVRVEREINEEYHADGEVRLLENHLIHYPFNKGFHAWLEKHNRYSSMEAKVAGERGIGAVNWRGFLSSDPQARRLSLKQLVYALPGRPLLMFLALYVVRGGFLEGRAGFTFCALRAFYEFMIDCKVRELKLREQGKPL